MVTPPEPPSGASLVLSDVRPIAAFAESVAALSQRRGGSESSARAWSAAGRNFQRCISGIAPLKTLESSLLMKA